MAKQLRIAVVGKTGNGKSSVANSIIGKKKFKTGLSANRVTKVTSSLRSKRISGLDIDVFDTTGLYQEGEDESEIRNEIEKCIVSSGLHAVVFVIKIGRFTKEEQEAVEQMKTLFGTSIFRFTIFAFTCINDLGKQPLEGFVHESAPVYLKDVIRESGSRIVGFDNRDKTKDKHSVKKIISMVAAMSQKNKEYLYSRELFEEAFQATKKRKKEDQEKTEIQRKLEFEKATAEKEAALKKKYEEECNTVTQHHLQGTAERETELLAKEKETTSGMKASVTMSVAGRDVRDTEAMDQVHALKHTEPERRSMDQVYTLKKAETEKNGEIAKNETMMKDFIGQNKHGSEV